MSTKRSALSALKLKKEKDEQLISNYRIYDCIRPCVLRFRSGCDYLFHVEGKPLNYCNIQSNYRQAQRKDSVRYTGTHCLRHGMATLAIRVGGMGLDSAMAMTGHKDVKLTDHYSKIDGEVQKSTSLRILCHNQGIHAEEKANEGQYKNRKFLPSERWKNEISANLGLPDTKCSN